MNLYDLIGPGQAVENIPVTGMTQDSRRVQPGDVFVAVPGVQADGRLFMTDAQARGAAVVIAEAGDMPVLDIPVITVPNTRRLYAEMAARLYPGQPDILAAVTGTNGKTSVADFTRQIWGYAGLHTASIGTLGVRSQDYSEDGNMTTPDPLVLHQHLSKLATSGVSRAVLEASSHGLDQCRLAGAHIFGAAFTNLSRDHLDYHKNETAYLYAKARLVTDVLASDGWLIVDRSTQAASQIIIDLAASRGIRTLCVGTEKDDAIRISSLLPHDGGLALAFDVEGRSYEISLPLGGDFQARNALVALGLAISTGVDMDHGVQALSSLHNVPGRMDMVARTPAGAPIYVDYAHTPDALERALSVLRPHVDRDVHVVFGCGGDRDRGKRPMMGAVAAKFADSVIVTDDNPRGENPADIRRAVREGCVDSLDIGDRRQAIATAMDAAQSGDAILVAGKGHEQGQIGAGGVVTPHSDIGCIRELVAAMPFRETGYA